MFQSIAYMCWLILLFSAKNLQVTIAVGFAGIVAVMMIKGD